MIFGYKIVIFALEFCCNNFLVIVWNTPRAGLASRFIFFDVKTCNLQMNTSDPDS